IALREVEDVRVRIMRGIGRERADRRTLQSAQGGIEFGDPRQRVFEVLDLDAEMVQARIASIAPRYAIQPDIAIADYDIPDRPGLARRLHPKQRLIEAPVQRVLLRGYGNVIDARRHGTSSPLATSICTPSMSVK